MGTLQQWTRDTFLLTTDPDRQDVDAIHAYLTRSDWAAGIDKETVALSVANSLCFSLFDGNQQVGFARLVTDSATFGYLCDVYILERYQKTGLGLWMMECCQSHPLLGRLRRIMLVTSTAPWLYQKVGYQPLNRPDFVWQINRPDIYRQQD